MYMYVRVYVPVLLCTRGTSQLQIEKFHSKLCSAGGQRRTVYSGHAHTMQTNQALNTHWVVSSSRATPKKLDPEQGSHTYTFAPGSVRAKQMEWHFNKTGQTTFFHSELVSMYGITHK